MYVIKNELDHFKEKKMQKLYRFSCQTGRLRIRYSFPDPDPTWQQSRIQPDPQRWSNKYFGEKNVKNIWFGGFLGWPVAGNGGDYG
jgi:hypothetical protein